MRRHRDDVHGAVSEGTAGLTGAPAVDVGRSALALGRAGSDSKLAIDRACYVAKFIMKMNVKVSDAPKPLQKLCQKVDVEG